MFSETHITKPQGGGWLERQLDLQPPRHRRLGSQEQSSPSRHKWAGLGGGTEQTPSGPQGHSPAVRYCGWCGPLSLGPSLPQEALSLFTHQEGG